MEAPPWAVSEPERLERPGPSRRRTMLVGIAATVVAMLLIFSVVEIIVERNALIRSQDRQTAQEREANKRIGALQDDVLSLIRQGELLRDELKLFGVVAAPLQIPSRPTTPTDTTTTTAPRAFSAPRTSSPASGSGRTTPPTSGRPGDTSPPPTTRPPGTSPPPRPPSPPPTTPPPPPPPPRPPCTVTLLGLCI